MIEKGPYESMIWYFEIILICVWIIVTTIDYSDIFLNKFCNISFKNNGIKKVILIEADRNSYLFNCQGSFLLI